jgi:hypothetical protein
MRSNTTEVFHNQRRLPEHIGIDPLQSIVQQSTALVKSQLISIVYMPVPARNSNYKITVNVKMRTNIFQLTLHKKLRISFCEAVKLPPEQIFH